VSPGTNTFDVRYDPCCPGPNSDESRFLEVFVTSTPVHGPPATVVLSPPDAVNTVGTEHTVTATVSDAMGRPVPSVSAALFGNATINGVATTYRIDVDDVGEPGAGNDIFAIQTASGYAAGGTLLRGNVQVQG
jgi:hypothetical protein